MDVISHALNSCTRQVKCFAESKTQAFSSRFSTNVDIYAGMRIMVLCAMAINGGLSWADGTILECDHDRRSQIISAALSEPHRNP